MRVDSLNLNTLLTVLNEVGAYIYTKDLNGRYTYVNSLVLELFGVSFDELIGKDDHSFFAEDKIESLLENDRRVLSGEVIETEESLIVKRTFEKRHFLVVKKPLYDENGNIYGMFGISTDITEQKNLEKRILEQKLFLDAILDNVDAYIYMKDKNRVFRYVNSKVANLFKLPSKEIIGKKDTDVISKEIADSFWESDFQVLSNSKAITAEEYYEDEEANSYYWSIKIPYILDDNTPCVLGFSTDITLLKEQEKEIKEKDKILHQQAKITAMGEMIENIAHQWRQPLSLISSITTGIKLKKIVGVYDEKDLLNELEAISNSVQFLSETIDYFRGFLEKDKAKSLFKISSIINKTLELILVDLKNNDIEIITSLYDIEIKAYQNEFIQVFINLINNAKDAFFQNQIEIKQIFIDTNVENDILTISVKDTAGGIKEDIIDRVFEPYFTTKHKSQGTGIGLFMCQQIIEKSLNGKIEVFNYKTTYENKILLGACFSIKIPLEK